MSYKSNGIKLTKCDSQQWKTTSVLETPSVKFAGEEAKDRLYEPKYKKKIVRVLTVVAYVFFVSLAAIMLSMYYVFLWNGEQKVAEKLSKERKLTGNKCENILAEIQKQIRLMDGQYPIPTAVPKPWSPARTSTTTTGMTEESTTWYDEFNNLDDIRQNSNFFKKLFNEYSYNDAD